MNGSKTGSGSTAASNKKILVSYFSWSGNTRQLARQIHSLVGGDIFEIVSVDKYPSDYDQCVEQAKRELDASYRPRLKPEVQNIESYDVVLVGYPNWWGTIPMPVASFLLKCDSPGKAIVPFCTHGGDRLGRSLTDITKLCPKSRILEALEVRGGNVSRAEGQIRDWLRRLEIMR